MAEKPFGTAPLRDPEAELERALIDQFLQEHGYDRASLTRLPPDQAARLLVEARVFAAGKLAEVAARAHYIHELHGEE